MADKEFIWKLKDKKISIWEEVPGENDAEGFRRKYTL